MPEAADLARKLTSEGERFAAFFASLTEAQWQAEVYTEGGVWTIRNVLAHLMTAERAFVRLFSDICAGGRGVSEDFSIDRYNASQQIKTRELSPADLLEEYRKARAEMIAFVSGLQDSDLEKIGRHPYLQETTLREMIKMVYIHNQVHYRDLKKVIA